MPLPLLSPIARRGLAILTVFTVLIGIVTSIALANHLLALPTKPNWRGLGLVLANVIALDQAWRGERWLRYLSAGYYAARAALVLLPMMLLGLALAVAPAERQAAGLEILTGEIIPALVPSLLRGSLYLSFAAAILFVPSVRLFLVYQWLTRGSLLQSLVDAIRLLPGFRRHVSAMSVKELIRPGIRQTRLTRAALAAIADEDLAEAIDDWLRYCRQCEESPLLTPGMQMVQAIHTLEAEVDNGGFHQYFWNKSISAAFEALEGYRLIGADEHVAIVLRAIDVYLREEEDQQKFVPTKLTELLTMYCAARDASSLTELDHEFYKMKRVETQMNAYIRNNPGEFAVE